MSRERWGTFSVIDHRNTAALVPDVLLYDRLIMPVPYDPSSNFDDRVNWEINGWDPQGLERRLEQLGDRAVRKPWDLMRQQLYRSKVEELAATKQDADNFNDSFMVTRIVLAQEQPQLQPGILRPVVVAAYHSEADFRTDFMLRAAPKDPKDSERAHLGLLLGHRLAIPIAEPENEETLLRAIDFSRTSDFLQKRRNLYDWQEQIISQGYAAEEAMIVMEQLIDEYNHCVTKGFRDVYVKFAFTVATITLGIAGAATLNPLVAASAILALVQFTTLDSQPVIQAGKSEPAAMFHDVKKVLG